jgi:hypothetical protein
MFRQGDVIVTPTSIPTLTVCEQLNHLILAEGEKTNHRHQIINGDAKLGEVYGMLYLEVLSPTASLSHEEHGSIEIPQGKWEIRLQREYVPPNPYLMQN